MTDPTTICLARRFGCVVLLAALTLLVQSAPVSADETSDIARILELNDAYAEASRARRAKEITRQEMQQRHKAIQQESRQINSSYGAAGSLGRVAWDQKVLAAKNAHTTAKRQAAQAAKAETRAAERAIAEAEKAAVRAEREAAEAEAARIAAAEAELARAELANEQADALSNALAEVELSVDFTPSTPLEEDALVLARLPGESQTLNQERVQLLSANASGDNAERIQQIQDRQAVLQPLMAEVRGLYSGAELTQLNLIASALLGDMAQFHRGNVNGMPAALRPMIDTAIANRPSIAQARQNSAIRRIEAEASAKDAQVFNWYYNPTNGWLALGVAMSFGIPGGLAMLERGSLTLAGRSFALNTVTGELLQADKRQETTTKVTQSGGGGTMIGGTGYVAPQRATIEEETTTFDTVYLQDEGGKEHEVELVDFHLKARPSNRLSLVSAGSSEGRGILVYNHTTGKHFTGVKTVRELMTPGFLWAIANTGLLVFATAIPWTMMNHHAPLLSGVMTAVIGCWVIGFRPIVARSRASLFLGGRVTKDPIQQVASV